MANQSDHKTVKKKLFDKVEAVSNEVKKWPEWKKGEYINVTHCRDTETKTEKK